MKRKWRGTDVLYCDIITYTRTSMRAHEQTHTHTHNVTSIITQKL